MSSAGPEIPLLTTPWEQNWRAELVGTLMFIVVADRILLIHKKSGHGAGRVNGPGGKLQQGESALSCAIRETREEVGLVVSADACRCVCEMRFVEEDGPQWLGFAFVANAFSGDMEESDEAHPFWCDVDAIPYAEMWPDDAIWLPRALALAPTDVPLVGNFLFCREVLLAHSFEQVPSIVDHWS